MARPAYGRAGKPIQLESNFFTMKIPRKLMVSQYSISIWRMKLPEELDRRRRRRSRNAASSSDADKILTDVSGTEPIFFNRAVFDQIYQKHGKSFGCRLAYDGRSVAYAPREVNRQCLGVMYKVMVGREGARPTQQDLKDGKAEEVQLKIEHAKTLNFDDIVSAKVGTIASTEYLAALDVVLGTTPMGRYVQIGRSFYSSHGAQDLGRDKMASAWRGFYQSARLSQLGLVVNMDESFTAFWNKGGHPLAELAKVANNGHELTCRDSRALRDVAQKLKALKVRAIHTGITYRVHGFSSKGADSILFDSERKGRKISISEYFADTYNIRLRNGHLPCVKTHPRRDTYLPIELLTVLENQRVAGVLNPEQTMSIVKFASSRPHIRKNAAIHTMQTLNHAADPVCKDFGVSVDSKLIKVDARVLPTPIIQYRGGSAKPVSGQWRAQKEFTAPAELNTWAVINMTRLRSDELQQFLRDVVKAGRKAGMKFGNPQPRIFQTRQDKIADEMRKVSSMYRNDKKLRIKDWGLQMILIVKEKQDAPAYNLIKRTGDLELGIATQVCLMKNCGSRARGRDMYCDNLILKINSKLGGQNAFVANYSVEKSPQVPDVGFVNIPHMILGADVTHPMAGGRSPSVAALVGSRDRQGVQYSGAIRNQPGRQEVIKDIGEMFKEVYEQWRANFQYKVHVNTVIMFRDGVSDGQFEEVMEVELEAIRKACTQISSSCRPKITYIIVTKRHHARFFGDTKNVDKKSGNILPGTVIDRQVTSREFYDFYLNSHAGIQGTSKPSKYTVLIDENNIPVDALQGYIFRLSHGFVRCNRSVSMVNSAYYAHLLAFRGRAYLGEDVSDNMSTASGESSVPPAARINRYLARRLYFV